ncbi:MAG: hypothetical protein JNJ45_05830 [Chthonomonas sp.]|nr:hypothetical protein [Chthonomonas sp.]
MTLETWHGEEAYNRVTDILTRMIGQPLVDVYKGIYHRYFDMGEYVQCIGRKGRQQGISDYGISSGYEFDFHGPNGLLIEAWETVGTDEDWDHLFALTDAKRIRMQSFRLEKNFSLTVEFDHGYRIEATFPNKFEKTIHVYHLFFLKDNRQRFVVSHNNGVTALEKLKTSWVPISPASE